MSHVYLGEFSVEVGVEAWKNYKEDQREIAPPTGATQFLKEVWNQYLEIQQLVDVSTGAVLDIEVKKFKRSICLVNFARKAHHAAFIVTTEETKLQKGEVGHLLVQIREGYSTICD